MITVWLRAFRLSHWAKNALVFVGPLLGANLWSASILGQTVLIFILFGLLASATYLLNDLADIEADRAHPTKRHRSIASGAIPKRQAALAAIGLGGTAFLASLALPSTATAVLAAYLAATLAYSFVLKRKAIYDVATLAGLFTLRIVAGCLPLPGLISPWLLTFSVLFFLGLAMVKRYAELARVVRNGGVALDHRGYSAADLPLLLSAGVASGFGAVLVLTSYLIHEQYPRQVYENPQALWAIIPILLIWILRAWHYTVHGRMNEDPVLFALGDHVSWAMGGVVAAVLITAWGGRTFG